MRAQSGARVPVACAAFIAHAGGDGSQRGSEPGSKQWGDCVTQPISQAFRQPAVNHRPFRKGYGTAGVSARRQSVQADGRSYDARPVRLRRQRLKLHPNLRQSSEARLPGLIREVAFGGLFKRPSWRLPWRTQITGSARGKRRRSAISGCTGEDQESGDHSDCALHHLAVPCYRASLHSRATDKPPDTEREAVFALKRGAIEFALGQLDLPLHQAQGVGVENMRNATSCAGIIIRPRVGLQVQKTICTRR
ncbi:hypothetical protein AMST5_00833 [freshwater sediment metagenome]|uniref:Uncharacterized protein n=1 Tax=freshwater sediment metagenome TaxID=556182 RepID=A0AA48LXM5_9ZZZZ